MNITELAIKLVGSETDKWFDGEGICQALGLVYWELDTEVFEKERRLTKHWNQKWICTDTLVGDAIYYFDGRPLAYSYQNARKSDENFCFFSDDIAGVVHEYLRSLILPAYKIVADPTMEVKDFSYEIGINKY